MVRFDGSTDRGVDGSGGSTDRGRGDEKNAGEKGRGERGVFLAAR